MDVIVRGLPDISEADLLQFINGALIEICGHVPTQCVQQGKFLTPCLRCELEGTTAGVHFATAAGARASMLLDGLECRGSRLQFAGPRRWPRAERDCREPRLEDRSTNNNDNNDNNSNNHNNNNDNNIIIITVVVIVIIIMMIIMMMIYEDRSLSALLGLVPEALALRPAPEATPKPSGGRWYERAWLRPSPAGTASRPAAGGSGEPDHYQTLGLTAATGSQDVREVFIQKCRTSGRVDALAVAAYYTLHHPVRRQAYDQGRILLEVFSGELRHDPRAVAFVLQHRFVQRLEVSLQDGMDLALALPRLTRQTCHRILVVRQAGPDSVTRHVLIACRALQVEHMHALIDDCVAEARGERAPLDGVVIATAPGVVVTLADSLRRISAATGAEHSFAAEDRIILRGTAAQLDQAVAMAQRQLGWKGRVLVPDGRGLDSWNHPPLPEPARPRSRGSRRGSRRSRSRQRPPQLEGPETDVRSRSRHTRGRQPPPWPEAPEGDADLEQVFEKELGARAPAGYLDPLGLTKGSDAKKLARLYYYHDCYYHYDDDEDDKMRR